MEIKEARVVELNQRPAELVVLLLRRCGSVRKERERERKRREAKARVDFAAAAN